MLREALFAKIHMCTVTECNPEYSGSITIDSNLLDATGLRVNEKVLVADANSTKRFETYVFRGEPGSGIIGVNGAAAQLTGIGHKVIGMRFCQLDERVCGEHRPKVVICDGDNRITEHIEYDPG